MELGLGHLTAFFAIALLSGATWHATMRSYCLAVVAAAATGAVVTYGALAMELGRAPHWFFLVVSLPLCGVVAAATGIPFNRHLTGSAIRLLGACAGLLALTILVSYGLVKLAEWWGHIFEFDAGVAFVVIGVYMVLLLGGISADLLWSQPRQRRIKEEEIALAISLLPQSPAKAAAELDRMPETVFVHSMHWTEAANVLMFVALVVWAIAQLKGAWAWGAALLLSGTCGYAAILRWRSGPCRLVITRDGFRTSGLGHENSVGWAEIDGYFVKSITPDGSFAMYYLIQPDGRTPTFHQVVAAGSGIGPAELAQLLNRRLQLWRIAHGVDSTHEYHA